MPLHDCARLIRVAAKIGGPEHSCVRICHCLQKGEARCNQTHAEQKCPKLCDLGCWNKPQTSHGHHEKPGNDAPAIAKFCRQPSSREGHEKIAKIVGKLNPGRLRQREMQLLLEMLVHDIDHTVAEAPQQKQGADQSKSHEVITTICGAEKGGRFHNKGIRKNTKVVELLRHWRGQIIKHPQCYTVFQLLPHLHRRHSSCC
jgi:hypothetical protein